MKYLFSLATTIVLIIVMNYTIVAQTTPLDNFNLPQNPIPYGISALEYSFDNDPGFGNAITVHFSPCTVIYNYTHSIDVSTLSNGLHNVFLRAKTKENIWGQTNILSFYKVSQPFQIPPTSPSSEIEILEYFFDVDPGIGNGTLQFVPRTRYIEEYSLVVDVTQFNPGENHVLYIRTVNPTSLSLAMPFAIGGPLPLTWISFSGRLQKDNSVLLKWETAEEKNVALFAIEHSNDGRTFMEVGSMETHHNSTGKSLYTFIDKNPASGKVFYRIKQIDTDSKFSYSPTIVVNIENNSQQNFYIINNPAKDKLRVHLGLATSSASYLQIFDLSGRIVIQKGISANPIQEIDISTLVSGIYFIRHVTKNGSTIARFKKE
ncbi:MAG: T9SS type A sorting domain-containing protein [Chitinophagaceae bacterium]|nr:T9SS type A sorting domain-containing protein [Chitinophagaceae bacterium]